MGKSKIVYVSPIRRRTQGQHMIQFVVRTVRDNDSVSYTVEEI